MGGSSGPPETRWRLVKTRALTFCVFTREFKSYSVRCRKIFLGDEVFGSVELDIGHRRCRQLIRKLVRLSVRVGLRVPLAEAHSVSGVRRRA